MRKSWVPFLSLLGVVVAAPTLTAQCAFSAERTATLPVSGSELARVAARAGSLEIHGVPGLREIRAHGRACASSREALAAVQLRAERHDSEAWLSVVVPDWDGAAGENRYASLDLVVEVPESTPLDVTDSSGDLVIRQVAALKLQDSSGDIRVSDVRGALQIDDSSGNVEVDQVRGDVHLSDSSGDLSVREVTGSVTVDQDSSGNIEIEKVSRDAIVLDDSSGDISATGVGGDFTVEHDTSGGIRYRDIAGRVSLPESKRARNR
jgi:hypothetical protein